MSDERLGDRVGMSVQRTVAGGMGLMPVMDVDTYLRRWNTMIHLVKKVMNEGQHYGTIPGTKKPTLLKPGAEMLTTFFGLRTTFASKRVVEDWSGENHGGEPFFYYLETCQLWRGDTLVAEADGSANSHESRYRWRWVLKRDIPLGLDIASLKTREGVLSEYQYAVKKAETTGKYGKPAEYWQQFKDAIAADQAVEGTREARSGKEYKTWEIGGLTYRVPNEDIASVVNTIKKIAQKRAFVASTLIAVNASEFFTQDLEDVDVANGAGMENDQTIEGSARVADKAAETKAGNANGLQESEQRESNQSGNGSRPWPAERILADMRRNADKLGRKDASKAQRETLVRCLEALFMDDSKEVRTAKRHALTLQFCGIESSKDDELLSAHCRVLIGWSIIGGDGEDKWEPHPLAIKEADAIIKLYEAERGQADMLEQDERVLQEEAQLEEAEQLAAEAAMQEEIPF